MKEYPIICEISQSIVDLFELCLQWFRKLPGSKLI